MTAYLDTQVAVWLYDGLDQNLSRAAKRQVESNNLLVSPIVLLELKYVLLKGRVRKQPLEIYNTLQASFGVNLCAFPFAAIAMEAVTLDWTTDPFDRLIVGHAKANNEALLITADRKIREHYAGARW